MAVQEWYVRQERGAGSAHCLRHIEAGERQNANPETPIHSGKSMVDIALVRILSARK